MCYQHLAGGNLVPLDSLPFMAVQNGNGSVSSGNHQLPNEEKMRFHQELIDSLQQKEDFKNLAIAYIRMVETAKDELGYRASDSLLHEALKINLQLGNPQAIMQTYNELFFLSFNTGNNKQAFNYAKEALKIAEEHHYQKSAAIIYSNISLMYIRQGDYEKANEYNFKSLKVFQQIDDTLQMARSKLSIGLVYIMLKDYDKALQNIGEARDDFIAVGDEKGYSISLTNIGLIYIHRKDFKLALRHFFEAVQIDEQYNDSYGISSNYTNIGEVYYQLGNLDKATQYLNQALGIYQKFGDKSGLATVFLKLSRILTDQGRLHQALDYCTQSIAIFDQTDEPVSKKDALAQLAIIHQKLGNYQLALNTFREATELKDSLFDIDKAAKILMIEEKYINERLTNENLNLRYSNDFQQLKIDGQKNLNRTYLIALIILALAMAIIIIQLRKKNIAYKFITRKNLELMKKEQELKNTRKKIDRLSPNDRKVAPTITPDEKEAIMMRLDKLLDEDKIFTRSDLTIEKLAQRLSTNRTYLSQIINEMYGKSYSNLINEYRVKEAMKLLSDPDIGGRYSIDAIAKDSGFNSISNFNIVFKKFSGVTPSVFIKNIDYQSLTPSDNTLKFTNL
ncbi:MAG: tetratricopeptide repeat protein [Bacteroidales bacterium]|nr:tetratricopeptide repeat protein [Bacteroidales bacterium]